MDILNELSIRSESWAKAAYDEIVKLRELNETLYTALAAPQDGTALKAIIKAERDACAKLCCRPIGWLHPNQQKIADEIRAAILARPTLFAENEDNG